MEIEDFAEDFIFRLMMEGDVSMEEEEDYESEEDYSKYEKEYEEEFGEEDERERELERLHGYEERETMPWTETSWERHPDESDEDYQERMEDLEGFLGGWL